MLTVLEEQIVQEIKLHVQKAMPPDPTGHDWPHVSRVLKNAIKINETEKGNLFYITLIALTHDLYDHKFFNGEQEDAEKLLHGLLVKFNVSEKDSTATVKQVFNLSFKNGEPPREPLSNEGKIVQDADRIEAIGAIGIARAFAYGGFKNRAMNQSECDEKKSVLIPACHCAGQVTAGRCEICGREAKEKKAAVSSSNIQNESDEKKSVLIPARLNESETENKLNNYSRSGGCEICGSEAKEKKAAVNSSKIQNESDNDWEDKKSALICEICGREKIKENNETTFAHFHDKLLKLYDLLNTNTAKQIALDRFNFMKEFVERFEEEWGQ